MPSTKQSKSELTIAAIVDDHNWHQGWEWKQQVHIDFAYLLLYQIVWKTKRKWVDLPSFSGRKPSELAYVAESAWFCNVMLCCAMHSALLRKRKWERWMQCRHKMPLCWLIVCCGERWWLEGQASRVIFVCWGKKNARKRTADAKHVDAGCGGCSSASMSNEEEVREFTEV